MGQKGYSPEFRQRALDLLGSGRKVVDVARDLGISDLNRTGSDGASGGVMSSPSLWLAFTSNVLPVPTTVV